MIGEELAYAPNISFLEKIYIKLFGVPITGLRIRLRRILPIISGNPKTILDAGCGRAVFSYQLAKMFPGAKVLGGDMDEGQLDINRFIADQVGLSNLVFAKMDIARLSYKEEFDLVLSVDNIEHIEDDDSALAHIGRALKRGGMLVMHVPAYERRWFFFKFQENFDVPGHFRPGYLMDEIVKKVRKAGFSIMSKSYTYGFLENLSNNISYLITQAEAKNKVIYAFLFPILNVISFMGHTSSPAKGAGILITAKKV